MYIIGVLQGPKILPLLFYLYLSAFSNFSDVNIKTKNIQTHLKKIHSWASKMRNYFKSNKRDYSVFTL